MCSLCFLFVPSLTACCMRAQVIGKLYIPGDLQRPVSKFIGRCVREECEYEWVSVCFPQHTPPTHTHTHAPLTPVYFCHTHSTTHLFFFFCLFVLCCFADLWPLPRRKRQSPLKSQMHSRAHVLFTCFKPRVACSLPRSLLCTPFPFPQQLHSPPPLLCVRILYSVVGWGPCSACG